MPTCTTGRRHLPRGGSQQSARPNPPTLGGQLWPGTPLAYGTIRQEDAFPLPFSSTRQSRVHRGSYLPTALESVPDPGGPAAVRIAPMATRTQRFILSVRRHLNRVGID